MAVLLTTQWVASHTTRLSAEEASLPRIQKWFAAQTPLQTQALLANEGARLVIFTDYQCPSCAKLVPLYQSVSGAARLKGMAVELVQRDYPIDANCNPRAGGAQHLVACDAATAVRIARDAYGEAKAGELSGWLYSQGLLLTREALEARLRADDLAELFRTRSRESAQLVRQDISLAHAVGLCATPTLLPDGIKLPNVTPQGLQGLLDMAVTPSTFDEHRRNQ